VDNHLVSTLDQEVGGSSPPPPATKRTRLEQAEIWLGFSPEQMKEFFRQARLVDYGYASLGIQ